MKKGDPDGKNPTINQPQKHHKNNSGGNKIDFQISENTPFVVSSRNAHIEPSIEISDNKNLETNGNSHSLYGRNLMNLNDNADD